MMIMFAFNPLIGFRFRSAKLRRACGLSSQFESVMRRKKAGKEERRNTQTAADLEACLFCGLVPVCVLDSMMPITMLMMAIIISIIMEIRPVKDRWNR